jgi:hypothetical protein
VLPFVARGTAYQIDRARIGPQRGAVPAAVALAPQAEGAGREQRDPDHVAIVRPVAGAESPAGPVDIAMHGAAMLRDTVIIKSRNKLAKPCKSISGRRR